MTNHLGLADNRKTIYQANDRFQQAVNIYFTFAQAGHRLGLTYRD